MYLSARQYPPRGFTPALVLLLNVAGHFRHGGHINCGRRTETDMTPEKICRLDVLASQLAEALMTAVICAQEIQGVVHIEIDRKMPTDHHYSSNGIAHGLTEGKQRPLVDE